MKNVIVLDDDPDQVDILVQALGSKQRQVRGFSNPLRALSELDHDPPDVFIADLSLPWIDGEDVMACVRRRRPDLRVFLVSGHERGAEVARASGIPFFLKPVDLNVLSRAVDQALLDKR